MNPLQTFLDRLQRNYHRMEFLSSDPLEFVHRYSDPWDQEAVALVASLLAYGNVKQIRRSVEDLLRRMALAADSPSEFVRRLEDPQFLKKASDKLRGFVHRFNRDEDLILLLRLLTRSWSLHGSLGAHFLKFLDPSAQDMSEALNGLVGEWRKWAQQMRPTLIRRNSFHYLLTAPADGSCCKRWCMFLRWMGRSESDVPGERLDLGLWTASSPLKDTFPAGRALSASQLILPLDTHTGRISQYLGLTSRKTMDWKAACEITARLRECDARDPTRYDFALSRLGILDLCQRKYRREICERCDLISVCRFARQGERREKLKERRQALRRKRA